MKKIMRLILVYVAAAMCICLFSVASYAVDSEPESIAEEYSDEADDNVIVEPENELFELDKSKVYFFSTDAGEFELYSANLVADLNDDGVTTAADARKLLRITSMLDAYDDDPTFADINMDGVIAADDARLLLRYSAELDKYYIGEDNTYISGWALDGDSDICYFSGNGILATGYKNIDGDYYYFSAKGKMCTGVVFEKSTVYNLDENGKGVNGIYDINGDHYYFENGRAKTGWITVDSKKYYFGADCKATVGIAKIGDKIYCFDSAGVQYIDGKVTIDGKDYYFVDGTAYTGWLFDNLDVYYYYTDGSMAKNTTIADVKFNNSGVASCVKLTTDNLQIYIREILKANGSSVSDIYNYVHNNYSYKYYLKTTPDEMVIRILTNRRGACYDYANLTKYLLEAAGYEAYIVVGKPFGRVASEHNWVLVNVNGVWRHMDTQKGTYLKTDAQMVNLGYKWSAQGLPAAV